MKAIIESGSKQYRVKEGDIIEVELLHKPVGEKFVFDKVLFASSESKSSIGFPIVAGCKVEGEIIADEVKGDKVICYKYKRRKNYHRKVGHRQKYSRVKITKIEF